jgi:hypothetical protein
MPSRRKNSAHAMAEAPAPLITTRTASTRLPTTSRALRRAAPAMMAVPCWSSWNTGMSSSSRSRASIQKQSGARMSSRLMPPKVGAMARTTRTNSSGSVVSTSMSNTSTSANRLNNTALPSMTGLLARAPTLPRPRTAVPLDTTATRLPLAV